MNIAVIGSGISGLSCAWRLRTDPAVVEGARADVTVYEANAYAGGHTHTVDVTVDGISHPVDTGFLVYNDRTYPRLVELFDTLGVETTASEMTFSVQLTGPGARPVEWAGTDLNTVFIQRRNLVDPSFLHMLADLLRFNRQARSLAEHAPVALETWTVGEFLDAHRYGKPFRDWYLLPMAAAIWSCSTRQMRDFPLATFVRFCANHGLLQVVDRPQWRTVKGGARHYVDRMRQSVPDVRIGDRALGVARVRFNGQPKVAVRSAQGTTLYDDVVLACHSDQSLRLLDDIRADEREVLGAIRYQPNHAILHVDTAVLPRQKGAWAAWNYRCDVASAAPNDRAVSVHYLLDKLQPVPFKRPVVLSLNPTSRPEARAILDEFDYDHPVFDARAIQAQRRVAGLQGRDGVWFCGAWTGYGFHEDGLKSGLGVADAITAREASLEARLAA